MKKEGIFIVLIIVLTLVEQVSAGVYFSQPESVYNLKDTIDLNINIDPIGEGFLKVDLVCLPNSVNIYTAIPKENLQIELPLTSIYMHNMNGECYFKANYESKTYESRKFKISKELKLNLDITNLLAKPGENITISGTAERLNGKGATGDIEIKIPLLSILKKTNKIKQNSSEQNNESESINESENNSKSVQLDLNNKKLNIDENSFLGRTINGTFSIKIFLPKDMPAGNYRIDVHAYETDSQGLITSEGLIMGNLEVLQVLKKIDIAINEQNIDPGETFSFKPVLYDQSNFPIKQEVSVIIKDSEQNRIFESITDSDKTINFPIPTNISAGYYELEVSKLNKKINKKFYINNKSIAKFELQNNTLKVTNIGNTEYDKDIQININGKPFLKSVKLKLGESKRFKLAGPVGNYDIKITDGEKELTRNGIPLTGRAVGVESIKEGGNNLIKTPLFWIFFLILMGSGILFLFRNKLKKKSFAYPFKTLGNKLKIKKKKKTLNLVEENPKITETQKIQTKKPENLVPIRDAEHVLVLTGSKNRVAVVVVNIKNKLSFRTKRVFQEIVKKVYQKKAVIYEKGDFLIIILTPIITRKMNNELDAAKIAKFLQISFDEHNNKFNDKIEYGISIGTGEMINKIEEKKLKFTPLGNFLNLIKKIAESAENKIILTEEIHNQRIPGIKSQKININGSEIYELKAVVDPKENEVFIQRFVERLKNEENKKQKIDKKENYKDIKTIESNFPKKQDQQTPEKI